MNNILDEVKVIRETSKKKRLVNFLIDLIAIAILMEITFRIESMVEFKAPLQVLRVFVAFGGYYLVMEFFLGKTVGKYFTRSRVVNRDGSKITFRTAVIRNLARWIPFEFVSLALGHDAKAWHDTISKTYVIDDPK